MSQLILHNVAAGISRLLTMPRDIEEAWARPNSPIQIAAATPAHRALFKDYESDLSKIVAEALEWWKGRLAIKQRREKLERREALKAMYTETIAGPGAAPEVVWLVRKYWLACEELNAPLAPPQRVPPEVFLVGWLTDGKHEDALEVLSGMIYWPLGLDKNGKWV